MKRCCRKKVKKSSWITSPQTSNAFYTALLNEILLPYGILQAPFFSEERPDVLNYGAIGFSIGHELSHAFDDNGRNYDLVRQAKLLLIYLRSLERYIRTFFCHFCQRCICAMQRCLTLCKTATWWPQKERTLSNKINKLQWLSHWSKNIFLSLTKYIFGCLSIIQSFLCSIENFELKGVLENYRKFAETSITYRSNRICCRQA